AVDLNGWVLRDEREAHTFRLHGSTVLEPGARLILVSDRVKFENLFGSEIPVVGNLPFGFGTSDAVRLFDETGRLAFEIAYGGDAWESNPSGTWVRLPGTNGLAMEDWRSDFTPTPGTTNPDSPVVGEPVSPGISWESATRLPEGKIRLRLRLEPGIRFEIERSKDLQLWELWKSGTSTDPILQLDDETAPEGLMFYRAKRLEE
ncbi:MAG: hypothetical protein AAF514_12345, partial [Verrucomicrobiota bacterium]